MTVLDLNGIISRVCSDLKERASSVDIYQIQTTGNRIATIAVDGVEYGLFESGPSIQTPNMDGVASAGVGKQYARYDHRHPTDTSRQATLISGTNIKTVNGNSLLGSGDLIIEGGLPGVTSSDNGKVLQVVNGVWSAASLPIYDGTVI